MKQIAGPHREGLRRIATALMALLAAGVLGGCNITTFDSIPLTEGPCDPHMPGDWHAVSDKQPADPSSVELKIDSECKRVEAVGDSENGEKPTHESLPLHLGHDGAWDYAWVDVAPFNRSKDPELSGFYLVRYRIHGDRMDLYVTDDEAIAKGIFDGRLFGTARVQNSKFRSVSNRVGARVDLRGFNEQVAFLAKPMRFERSQQAHSQ